MVKKQPRIEAIDLLRGLFIIVMIIDHIARFPNGLDYFSGRNALWFSAAEGFVTLSGILVGYIYMPKIVNDTKGVFKKLLRRAATLYACVITLSLFFILYSLQMFAATDFNQFTGPVDLLFQLLTLQYSFGWAEFLTHYVIFLIAAPFVLYAFSKGHARLVLLTSSILWVVSLSLSENQTRFEFTMSWQLLFIWGMYIGTHLLDIKNWFNRSFAESSLTTMVTSLWASAVVIYILAVMMAYGTNDIGENIPILQPAMAAIETTWTPINEHWFSWWSDKSTLAPIRVFTGFIVFWALFLFFYRYSKKINQLTDGILMTFGKKPLVAYSVGALVIFAIEKYVPKPTEENRHFIANLIVTIFALVITFIITKNSGRLREVFKKIYR